MTRRPVPSGSVHSSFLVPFKTSKRANEILSYHEKTKAPLPKIIKILIIDIISSVSS